MHFYVRATFAFEDQQFIASGSEDGYVYIWDIKKRALAGRLGTASQAFGHLHMVNEVATVGSGVLVSASDDCSCIVWNLNI